MRRQNEETIPTAFAFGESLSSHQANIGKPYNEDPMAFRLRYEPPRRSDSIGFRIVAVETGGAND